MTNIVCIMVTTQQTNTAMDKTDIIKGGLPEAERAERVKSLLPIKTMIGGYSVDIDTDDGLSTWCHVHDYPRDLHASLGFLQDMGGFEDDHGNLHLVPTSVLDKIETWALSTGLY